MRDGWRRHRRLVPTLLAVSGLGLLALGLSAHEGWVATADPEAADRLLTSVGALTLAAAHLVNWRWRHRGGGHKLLGMTDAPRHQSIAAILPCSDLDASTAFYMKLGLSVVSDYGTYRLLEDGKGWQLHLTNESGPDLARARPRILSASISIPKASTNWPNGCAMRSSVR